MSSSLYTRANISAHRSNQSKMGANTSRHSTSLSYHSTLLNCLFVVLILTSTVTVSVRAQENTSNDSHSSTFSLSSPSPPSSQDKLLESRQHRSSNHPRVSITPGLPSTSSLPDSLSSTFDSILSSLSSTADSLTSRAIRSSHLDVQGLPGTSITSTEDFKSLQAYLDCTVGEGEWVYDPLGSSLAQEGKGLPVHKMESKFSSCDKRFYKGRDPVGSTETEWDVRDSLKYHFVPSSTCDSLLPSQLSPSKRLSQLPSRTRFCELLAHKSLLLLGSTTQYSLHDLLLDYTTIEPQSCYGDLYCKEHALCGGILGNDKGSEKEKLVENWEVDERVYHRLPLPPPSSDLSPRSEPEASLLESRQSKSLYPSPTYSTLLRYRRTDGLRPASAQTLPSYQHPFTSISEKNQQWLADSRRSDLVIIEKQPIPLPLRSHNSTFDTWFYSYMEDDSIETIDKIERIFEAVEEVTEIWMRELMDALKSIRSEPSPLDQLVVYRSGWRIHYDCGQSSSSSSSSPGDGPPPLSTQPTLRELINRSSSSNTLQPLHVIYHNLQLLLQNHLTRTTILPRFGIPYLDLETPLSIMRSGLLGGSGGPGVKGMRSSTSGDCERYCFPSPGLAVEGGFVGGLQRLMELGWGGSWEGDEWRNLRLRMEEREKGR